LAQGEYPSTRRAGSFARSPCSYDDGCGRDRRPPHSLRDAARWLITRGHRAVTGPRMLCARGRCPRRRGGRRRRRAGEDSFWWAATMSGRAVRYIDAALGDERRWAWRSQLRLGIEFLVLFALSLLFAHAVLSGASGTYPNPLWLPVIILSLQHGTLAGITAAAAASGLFLSEG